MKNLSKFTLIVLMFISLDSFSQESIIGEIKYSDLEKYIDLAVQNYPRVKITDVNVEKAKTDISMNAISYLDIFNASYFYRPNNKAAVDVINPFAVNGFQLSVNVNLGNFLQKPLAGKKARADYKIAKLEAEDFRLTLATEVKKRYYAYIQQINQLKIYTQSVQDNQNVADNLKNKFEKGEVALDTYNQSRINLTIASTSKIQTEVNLLSAKDALEEIIGMKLSEVK